MYLKQGLINLGFVFLATNPAFGNENIAEKHWKLGLFLLLEVIKINRNNTRIVVHKLSNFIITKENIAPYISNIIILIIFALTCDSFTIFLFRLFTHVVPKTSVSYTRKLQPHPRTYRVINPNFQQERSPSYRGDCSALKSLCNPQGPAYFNTEKSVVFQVFIFFSSAIFRK